MKEDKLAKCVQSLRNIGAIKEGHFVLKSGQTSNIYFDLRTVISYPLLLSDLGDLLVEKMKNIPSDLIVGVPYTGLFFATSVSLKTKLPMVMRRKEKKDHGTQKKVEGLFQKGQKVLIIEDVVTTGSSILETVKDLEEEGLVVKDVLAILSRNDDVKVRLEKQGYNFHCLLTMDALV